MTAQRPLKILQVNSAIEMGGGETHLLTLLRGLHQRGHELSLLVRPASPLPQRITDLPVKIEVAGLRNSLDLVSAVQLARVIRRDSIDIVHCHHARDFLVAAAAVRMATWGKLILTRHLLYPLKNNLPYRWALAVTGRIITVSNAVHASVLSTGLFAPEKVVTVYNGIDLNRFAVTSEARAQQRTRWRTELQLGDNFTIAVIGQLAPHKGQAEFLEAAAVVSRSVPTARFLIVGRDQSVDQSYRRHLETLVSKHLLEGRVQILDFVENVPGLMAAIDLLVLPSQAEPFGLVLVEAMASGTAVIATAVGGPCEIIEPERSGLLVPARDPDRLATAILRLEAEPNLRERLALNGQARARQLFSAPRMVEETEKVYYAVL